MFEFKTETTVRYVEQIDMYTYAYGNPADYVSDPNAFKTSACEASIEDIVNAVGGDLDFIRGCRTEADFMSELIP